jgi:hypothetical protein
MNDNTPLAMTLCKRAIDSDVFHFFTFQLLKKTSLVRVTCSPISGKIGCGFANFVFKVFKKK